MLLKKYKVESYTFVEYREIQEKELMDQLTILDKTIAHIKRNKAMYIKLVLLIAITIDKGTLTAFASGGLEANLANKFTLIIEKLIFLSKYACMGLGLKDMIICLLNGGNMREASFAGIQFWLGYLFLEFYPTLYN
jgi:hypothetical protein